MAIFKTKGAGKKSIVKLVAVLVAAAVFVGSIAFGAFYYHKYQQLNRMTPDQFSKRDNARLLSQINKVYTLPKDQPDTIATVNDKESLKKQYPFFGSAENGDVVLIYQKAQLALVYRPSTKQIVKVGPINVQSSIRIKVIGDENARKAIEKTLADNKVTANDGGDAKTNPSGVIVVDLSGKSGDQAKTLAQLVKGQVGSLPDGEDKPADVDLLVITGPQTP